MAINERAIRTNLANALNRATTQAKKALKKSIKERISLKPNELKKIANKQSRARFDNLFTKVFTQKGRISAGAIKSQNQGSGGTSFKFGKTKNTLKVFKQYFSAKHKRAGKAIFLSAQAVNSDDFIIKQTMLKSGKIKRLGYVVTGLKFNTVTLSTDSASKILQKNNFLKNELGK